MPSGLFIPDTDVDADQEELLLYPPAPQLESFDMTAAWDVVTPQQAAKHLARADECIDFKQRPTYQKDVARFNTLMRTRRFVHYLPIPLCFDPDGVLVNGKHRMTALAGQDASFGFVIVRNVPRWMFPYLDTGRAKSERDVLLSDEGNNTGKVLSQEGTIVKGAMRYLEFIYDIRKETGWKDWVPVRDEKVDVAIFKRNHLPLLDMHAVATRLAKRTRLNMPALLIFNYYQKLAWPQGERKLEDFWDALERGARESPGNPARALTDYTSGAYLGGERFAGTRELHLILLFSAFTGFVKNAKVLTVKVAHGLPMIPPYHPRGDQAAIDAIREALPVAK